MMGRRKGEQGQLFYAFDLEAVVRTISRSGALPRFSTSPGSASSWPRTTLTPGVLR